MAEDPQDDSTLQIQRALMQYAQAKFAARQVSDTTERLESAADQPMVESDALFSMPQPVRALPLNADGSGPRWLISLTHGDDQSRVMMRIKLLADVALGVTRPPHPVPDLDLSELHAAEKGVSRRHAILRPGLDYLYLIPLQSTNGTRVNGSLIPTGTAVALHDGDVISLGALHLTLGIEAAPEQLRD